MTAAHEYALDEGPGCVVTVAAAIFVGGVVGFGIHAFSELPVSGEFNLQCPIEYYSQTGTIACKEVVIEASG